MSADAILLAPSNPITSIGPILAVPGIREALRDARAPIVAVSPVVGGAPVAGRAGVLLGSQGLPVSIAGVAQAYREFLAVLVVDVRDANAANEWRRARLTFHSTKTSMLS